MKTKKRILMLLLAMLVGPLAIFAQNKEDRNAQKKADVKELILSGKYKIDVNTAFPMQGNSIQLTPRYSLEISNDSIISYLPYYGRAYSIPYGGGDGLTFKAIIKEYTMDIDKKERTHIKCKARNPEDMYEFNITVYNNGSANIDVSMQNRQSISFLGELQMPKDKM